MNCIKENAFEIVTALLSATAIIISLFSLAHHRIEAINAYFENDRSKAMLNARKIAHNLETGYDPVEIMNKYGNEIAYIIISYSQAAVLVKKRQLPFWIFSKQGPSGYAVIRMWEKLEPYIDMRRKGYEDANHNISIYPNPSLANSFEELYKRIMKAYSK